MPRPAERYATRMEFWSSSDILEGRGLVASMALMTVPSSAVTDSSPGVSLTTSCGCGSCGGGDITCNVDVIYN